MKTLSIVLVLALVGAPTTALATTAARDAPCAPLSECLAPIIDLVKCIGDALNGHACHRAATATAQAPPPDPEAILSCVGVAVQNILDGITPEMCTPYKQTDASADGDLVECTVTQARRIVEGRPVMPCAA